MENQEKISSKCTIKQENAVSDNILLRAVCGDGDSANSLQFLSTGVDCKSGVNSRLIKEKNACNETKNETNFLEMSSTHVQLNNNCSIYFLKELKNDSILTLHKTTNGNILRPIAPKSSDSNFTNKRLVIKKRDDKRRVTHNEVERRRRDKLNNWIFKLKELIPESTQTNPQTKSKAKRNGIDSKSEIVIRACEYITAMQKELKSLRMSPTDNGNLRLNNPELLLETTSHDPTHEVEIKDEPSTEETEVVKYEADTKYIYDGFSISE